MILIKQKKKTEINKENEYKITITTNDNYIINMTNVPIKTVQDICNSFINKKYVMYKNTIINMKKVIFIKLYLKLQNNGDKMEYEEINWSDVLADIIDFENKFTTNQ
jgi:hypothetical protein